MVISITILANDSVPLDVCWVFAGVSCEVRRLVRSHRQAQVDVSVALLLGRLPEEAEQFEPRGVLCQRAACGVLVATVSALVICFGSGAMRHVGCGVLLA